MTSTCHVKKQILAKLDRVYAVSPIQINGRTYFLAATEERGKCLIFSPPYWKVSVVWDGPGGCMSLVPVPGREKTFVAIQKFFPIFQSEHADIVYVKGGEVITEPWHVTRVLDLPFVHRIEIMQVGQVPFLVAGTLCGGKVFQDDWSQPGAVYAGAIADDASDKWFLEPILEGISKNHGMHVTIIDEKLVVMVSGKEGLFMLRVPEKPGSQWQYEQLLEREVSDVYSYDIDGDGVPEIVTIEPFHGNRLVVYRRMLKEWQPVFETSIDFGHVVWAGEILGETAVLGGCRGRSKELFLLRPKGSDLRTMSREILDSDVGPTHIAVVHKQNCDLIVSANHGSDEVALYELTL